MSLLAAIRPPGRWVLEALCTPETAEMWVDDSKTGARARVRAAQAVCAQCPVAQPCRSYAVRTQPVLGVWGGVDFGSRQVQRAIRPRNPTTVGPGCGTAAGCQAHYARQETPCEACSAARREEQRARRARLKEQTAC